MSELSRVRTCISMRGAERPARAPPATLLHGALGIKKAALLPSIANTTISRSLPLEDSQGTFAESTRLGFWKTADGKKIL